MNQLTHWNPFKSLAMADLPGGIDELFRGFGMRPLAHAFQLPEIRLDVNENDKAYLVKADIPGVDKENIDVTVDGRLVTITAKATRESSRMDETSLYSERSEGQIYRSFSLPGDVDGKAAEAHYEKGVLALKLPKKTDGNGKRIKIS
jgi:HSP20 family protein